MAGSYAPIAHPSAWRGEDLRRAGSLEHNLTEAEIEALRGALRRALESGKSLQALERSDFALPGLHSALGEWRRELLDGRGFVLIRGLPVNDFSAVELEWLYWGLGLQLGRAVPQNADGDLLGHVRDTGEDPAQRGCTPVQRPARSRISTLTARI